MYDKSRSSPQASNLVFTFSGHLFKIVVHILNCLTFVNNETKAVDLSLLAQVGTVLAVLVVPFWRHHDLED